MRTLIAYKPSCNYDGDDYDSQLKCCATNDDNDMIALIGECLATPLYEAYQHRWKERGWSLIFFEDGRIRHIHGEPEEQAGLAVDGFSYDAREWEHPGWPERLLGAGESLAIELRAAAQKEEERRYMERVQCEKDRVEKEERAVLARLQAKYEQKQ